MKQRITAAELKAMTMKELAAWIEFNACAINRTMVMSWGHEELFKGYHIRPEYIGWKAGRLIVKAFHFTSRTKKADAQSFAEWLHWAIFGEYPAEETETEETEEAEATTEAAETEAETIEETAEEVKEVVTMKKYFKVTFEYAEGIYCTNLAHAETAEDVEREYSKYPWKSIKEAQPWDVDEAKMKGMPIIEAEAAQQPQEAPQSAGEADTESNTTEAAEADTEVTQAATEKEANTMTYTITRNEAFNSLEITFDGKPSEAVRDALKALRFRWHGAKKLWYGYTDEETARAAIEGADKTEEAAPAVKAGKPAPQDHIKIYWNGIKIDGGKLIRCYYSLNNDYTVNGDCVSISARDYADLPRDLLPVHNDTDIYTDYFDSDRATLTPDHPLYKYFRFAAMKARARDAKTYCNKLQKDLDAGKGRDWQRDLWQGEIETHKGYIDAYNAETDPGQPTAADLEAIDKRRQEAENASRAAEHEAELKERAAVLNMKNDGRRMIEAAAEVNPIRDGEPVVTINWSEHPAFYQWGDGELKLSISAADSILRALDLKAHNDPDHGYYKTSFTITGAVLDGEETEYHGRYDLGDCYGGLIQHIRAIGEWERTHETFGKEKAEPDETNDRIQFADYLEQFTA